MQEIHNVTTYHRRFTSYTNLLSSKDRSRHHARPPEHYAELFDTNLNNLFSGRMLNIGDPNLAVDLPNVFTIDVMYKPTTYKQSHPSIALFPHTPFLLDHLTKSLITTELQNQSSLILIEKDRDQKESSCIWKKQ